MKYRTILNFLAGSALMLASCSCVRSVDFRPDVERVLDNPLSGWVMYLGRAWDENFWEKEGYDAMPTSEGTVVRVSDYARTAYIRTIWSSLEPEEGHYAWRDSTSRIFRLFKSVEDRGMRLAFRIVVDGRDQGQNTPIYVINAGAKYYTSGNGIHKSPYPDDPVFQKKYARFIEALAEDFNDPDRVEFIDAFGLGKWGESHAMEYRDPRHKTAVVAWITALYARTFTKVPLVIHYHRCLADANTRSWGAVAPETEDLLAMAIDRGYILRHDAFGMNDYYQDWEKDYAKRWRHRLPILLEGGWITAAHHRYWIDSAGKYREGHSEDVRRGEYEAAREACVNMMDLRINDEVRSWFGTSFDLVKDFIAEGGYRLYPSNVTAPRYARAGATVSLVSTWENLGWGYCPVNIRQWDYCYRQAAALLDTDGRAVRVFVNEDSDLSRWIRGNPVSYTQEIDLGDIPAGRYTWAVGLVDVRKDNSPVLEMALAEKTLTPQGWAKVCRITIQ